jgi:alkylhydroperoxidase family enzyme
MDDAHAAPRPTFLAEPPSTPQAQALYDDDRADPGYVMNLSRLWAHQPAVQSGLSALIGEAAAAASLTLRQRGILVTAGASAMGDAYCSLAWGRRLADEAGDEVATSVLRNDDEGLDPSDRVLARWARQVAEDPNGASVDDVEALRAAGFDDTQIFAITCFIALRIAFSTVNDALGALPDHELGRAASPAVREAVTWGRPIAPPSV